VQQEGNMQSVCVIECVRAEFLEMPCLSLTPDQVRRFCGIEDELVQHVLETLVEAQFLYLNARGCYARVPELTRSSVAA
jgi:hypothetical protein